jgi:hypothetical protein
MDSHNNQVQQIICKFVFGAAFRKRNLQAELVLFVVVAFALHEGRTGTSVRQAVARPSGIIGLS